MHELSYENGKAQSLSVRETPWHKEGIVIQNDVDYRAAISLLRFDYPIEKRPHFRPVNPSDLNGGYTEAGDSFYVYRPDTNKVLGSVGAQYEIVNNLQAFATLEPLCDSGLFTIETGGVLRDGADAWLLGRWQMEKLGAEAREVFGNELVPYGTVMANHNGRRPVILGETPIRIVCANTMGAAENDPRSRWVNIPHKKGAGVRLVEAAEQVFGNVLKRFENLAQQYKLLKNTLLTQEQFGELVLDAIAPDPRKTDKFNPEAKLADLVVTRALRKRNEISRLWKEGKGHTGEPNSWYAYNAAVEALDHNRDLWPTRDGSWRTASLLDGQLAKMKQVVLDNLVLFAQAA